MNEFLLKKYPNGVEMMTVPLFEETGLVKAVFTTKKGGVSQGIYTSLNLGERTDDSTDNVNENYNRVFEALNLKKTFVVTLRQIHSDRIIKITKDTLNDGMQQGGQLFNGRINVGEGDGLITNEKNISLVTYHADCIPVFFLDTKNKVIGIAHSGWKGTLEEIAGKTFEEMQKEYGSEPIYTMAAIGPGIGFCCFETGADVYELFHKKYSWIQDFTERRPNGKYMLDLKGIIKKQLEEKCISRINLSKDCTYCEKELFYSHRRDKGKTGRMAAIIQLI